jgi:hypothetical protein
MEWYEIICLAVAWVVGVYFRGRIYEERNGFKRNERWGRKK